MKAAGHAPAWREEHLGTESQRGQRWEHCLIVLVLWCQVRHLAMVECSLFSLGIIFRAFKSVLSKMNAYTVST